MAAILPQWDRGRDEGAFSDFFAVLGRFEDHLIAADYAPKTIEAYLACIERAGRRRRRDPRGFTRDDVNAILAGYEGHGGAKGIMARAFKCFYAWAEDGELLVNPARHVRIPKPKLRKAAYLDEDQLTRVLIAATLIDPRAPWALLLAYATGGRAGSLCAATPANVKETRNGWVLVFEVAKNDDPYVVPLGELGLEAVRELERLIEYTPPRVARRRPTLIGVGTGQLWRWAHDAGELAELKTWPHLFRHTFATHLLDRGVDPETWRILMNHKDLSQMPGYVGDRPKRAWEAVELL